jgi:hypothetical protein
MTTMYLPINDISTGGQTQARAEINEATVAEYAAALEDGATLPPVLAFHDGAAYHLADGFHRLHANRKIGATTIDCEVRTGTLLEARLYAYGANKTHGLQRTNADKRKAVGGMLADFADWSDRAIAKHVGVAHTLVSSIRSPEVAAQRQENRNSSRVGKVEPGSTQPKVEPGSTPDTSAAEVPAPAEPPTSSVAEAPTADPRDLRIKAQEEHIETLARDLAETIADNASMGIVFESDDKMAATLKQNKQLRAEVAMLRERVNGLLGEKNEAVRMAKSWQRKAEKGGVA